MSSVKSPAYPFDESHDAPFLFTSFIVMLLVVLVTLNCFGKVDDGDVNTYQVEPLFLLYTIRKSSLSNVESVVQLPFANLFRPTDTYDVPLVSRFTIVSDKVNSYNSGHSPFCPGIILLNVTVVLSVPFAPVNVTSTGVTISISPTYAVCALTLIAESDKATVSIWLKLGILYDVISCSLEPYINFTVVP